MGIYCSISLGCDIVRFSSDLSVEEDWQLGAARLEGRSVTEIKDNSWFLFWARVGVSLIGFSRNSRYRFSLILKRFSPKQVKCTSTKGTAENSLHCHHVGLFSS